MSDQIIARVSQSLAKEQSLESLVRQLLEMLEMVTDMESTYLTKVDVEARLQQIRGEYHLGDVDLYYPGASLGIVEVDPETTDADSALHAADIAMYQEKKHKQKTPFVAHPALHS